MQEIGEQLDNAIVAYAILLQLMHCSTASCVLHIACCMLRWCKIPLRGRTPNRQLLLSEVSTFQSISLLTHFLRQRFFYPEEELPSSPLTFLL